MIQIVIVSLWQYSYYCQTHRPRLVDSQTHRLTDSLVTSHKSYVTIINSWIRVRVRSRHWLEPGLGGWTKLNGAGGGGRGAAAKSRLGLQGAHESDECDWVQARIPNLGPPRCCSCSNSCMARRISCESDDLVGWRLEARNRGGAEQSLQWSNLIQMI